MMKEKMWTPGHESLRIYDNIRKPSPLEKIMQQSTTSSQSTIEAMFNATQYF